MLIAPYWTGWHTVAVTQRERFDAALRAAGLRLSPMEIDALLPAWLRYRTLVTAFEASILQDRVTIDA